MSDDVINKIYNELMSRYSRISVSTIKEVLAGIVKVSSKKVNFKKDKTLSPSLDEAEDAFKKFNCAIFTAFRGGYTLEENMHRNTLLKADMESLGMIFRPVNGCYREADWDYPCVEYCYFVFDDEKADNFAFFQKVYQLSAKYDQDSFLYKRSGINRTAFLVATTNAGRRDLKGDIKFAGQLYLDVPDVDAWTDCSDGRFAFQLKGMIRINTPNEKIKLGEGSIFDIKSYRPDGIAVLNNQEECEMIASAISLKDKICVAQHVFGKNNYSERYIHKVLFRILNELRDQKCQSIGLHCSAMIEGSREKGAAVVYDALMSWVKLNEHNLSLITLVDTYGDYGKVIEKL